MATIKDSKRDRPKHSAAALSKNFGGPKKGGAGRHGWGKLGDESRGAALNERDPNYESDYDENISYEEIPIEAEPEAAVSKGFNESYQSIRKFKQAITQSVEEYLSTSNREEFIKSLTNLNLTMYHHEIPRLAILTSLDKSEEQRKKISFLLQYLHQHDYITVHQVQEAFRHLFNRLSDITLDIPNAEALLNQFLSSAVAAEYMTEKAAQSIARASEALKDVEQVKIAKTKIRDLLTEYFDNQDLGEAEARLTEMKAPHFHHILVKEAVSMSMDRSNRERELASYLLGNLSLEALDSAEIEKGFEYLLGRIDDLYNDVPKALEFLSCFIARAIVDELLPPAFVARRELPEQDMGAQVLKQASVLLSKKHPYHRLSRIWGPGDGREVPALKKAVKDLCSEYFSSGDSNEAKRCIKELNSPHFSHEVVMRLIVMAMDNGDKEVAAAIQLLKVLTAEGVVSKRQAELGFGRVFSALDELSLDQPNAKSIFQRISKDVGVSASS